MVKSATIKCTLITLLTIPFSLNADESKNLKLRSLGTVIPKVYDSKQSKESVLDKVSEFIGDDIDLTLFDTKKDGWSVYAKISKVSRLGLRYNY
jgi:hypothetical protein